MLRSRPWREDEATSECFPDQGGRSALGYWFQRRLKPAVFNKNGGRRPTEKDRQTNDFWSKGVGGGSKGNRGMGHAGRVPKFHLFILLLGRNFIFSSKPFKISSFHPLLGRNFIFSSMSQSNLGRNFIFSSTSHLIQVGEISSFHPSFCRPNFIFSPKIWLGRNFIQIWTSQ